MKTAPPKEIRVVIIDDHRMFREQLAHLIDKADDMKVCGQTDNIRDGLALIKRTQPSIAIIDITLRGSGGLELLKDLRAHKIPVPALVLSIHDESLYAERALRAGARGYVTKHQSSKTVLVAIRRLLNGQVYVSETVGDKLLSNIADNKTGSQADPLESLSDRELEVFRHIGRSLGT